MNTAIIIFSNSAELIEFVFRMETKDYVIDHTQNRICAQFTERELELALNAFQASILLAAPQS